ncbi:MAG: hypothetical protein ACO35C_04375 [Pontimonas sp.]
MQRKFILHVQPNDPLIDEIKTVVEPMSIITKDWVAPVRTIPTIQFFPEVRELIEGEEEIRKYIEQLRPRPLATERVLPPIKTKVEKPAPPLPTIAEPEAATEPEKPEVSAPKPRAKSAPKSIPKKKKVTIKE